MSEKKSMDELFERKFQGELTDLEPELKALFLVGGYLWDFHRDIYWKYCRTYSELVDELKELMAKDTWRGKY